MMKKNTVDRKCPVCKRIYRADPRRLRWGRQTTCSRKCSYFLRAKMKERKSWFVCSFCGRKVERSPSQVNGKHGSLFCSRTCHYAGRSAGLSGRVVVGGYNITPERRAHLADLARAMNRKRKAENRYGHTPESRAKLSKATANALAKGKVGRPSKLENTVAQELTTLGIRFTRQRIIRDRLGRFSMVIDFWLTDLRVALEVNGTYWHADPRVYSTLNSVQTISTRRYQRKLNELRRRGIRLVEVWELDIKADPAKAVLEAYTMASMSS